MWLSCHSTWRPTLSVPSPSPGWGNNAKRSSALGWPRRPVSRRGLAKARRCHEVACSTSTYSSRGPPPEGVWCWAQRPQTTYSSHTAEHFLQQSIGERGHGDEGGMHLWKWSKELLRCRAARNTWRPQPMQDIASAALTRAAGGKQTANVPKQHQGHGQAKHLDRSRRMVAATFGPWTRLTLEETAIIIHTASVLVFNGICYEQI